VNWNSVPLIAHVAGFTANKPLIRVLRCPVHDAAAVMPDQAAITLIARVPGLATLGD
jgi:hypothetical protein